MPSAINSIHHVLFVVTLSSACFVGPSYTSCGYFLLLFLHTFFHEVQIVSYSCRTIVLPYKAFSILALLAAFGHTACMTTGSIYYAEDRSAFTDWYNKHTDLLQGFGFYMYEAPLGTLDRFLRHLIPSVLIVATSIARLATAENHASVSSTVLLFAKMPRDRPILHKRSSISSFILPVITVLSGAVAVLWARVLTVPYLLIFLISTSAWGLHTSHRQFSPDTYRIVLLCMWLITATSLSLHMIAQQQFFKTPYEDNTSTFGWIGVLRLPSFSDIFDTSDGREYVGHILVLPIICYISWRGYFNISEKAARHLLEAKYIEVHGEDEAVSSEDAESAHNEFTAVPQTEPPPASPVDRMSGSNDTPMTTIKMNSHEEPPNGGAVQPEQIAIHVDEEEPAPAQAQPSVEDFVPDASRNTEPARSPVHDSSIRLLTEELRARAISKEQIAIRLDESASELTCSQTHASETAKLHKGITGTVRYFMSKYSPHALGLVLGLTALVDPSFLSAIWLILLFMFMWCVLVLENVKPIITILPFALVWSGMHVTAIYVAAIPSVINYGNDTLDKLDAIGVTRHDGSDTAALASHASLIVLIAIVIRASSLVSETRTKRRPARNPTTAAILLKIQETLLSRAQYVSLLITVIVGCLHVDLLQATLLVFFVVFASSPRISQKYWGVLLAYQIMLTLFLYLYNVTSDGFHIPDKIGQLDFSTLVEGPMSSMWELTPFLVMVFFSMWQLRLYKKTGHHDDTPPNPKVILFGANATLLATWVAMILVILFAAPTLMTAGYLVLFIWVSAVTAFGGGVRSASLAMTWIVALCYSTACFLANYLFQFHGLATYFSEAVNAVLDCDDGDNATTQCVRQFGFKPYDGVSSRVANLFPHWAIAALVIMQASYLSQAWNLPDDTDLTTTADPNPYYVKVAYAVVRCKRFLTVVSPVAILVALWIASSDSRSLNAGGYFLMLISTMVTGTVNSLMLVLYSSCVIMLKFWYQYKFFPTFMSTSSYQYFGLEKVGTIWSCQKAETDEDLCRFISGCTWDTAASRCLLPSSDPSLVSKIWIDVLVLVCAMICRRARLWAFHDAPEGVSTEAYLREMTVFDHPRPEPATGDPSSPNSGHGSPASPRSPGSPQSGGTPKLPSTGLGACVQGGTVEVSESTDSGGKEAKGWRAEVPEDLQDITDEQIRLIIKIQSAWRAYLVKKRLTRTKLAEAIEGSTLTIPAHHIEVILSAMYTGELGYVDVTNVVRKKVEDGGLFISVSDPELEIDPDLNLGNAKVLTVSYLPEIQKSQASAIKEAVQNVKSKAEELVNGASPYVLRFSKWLATQLKWAVDFGFLACSYELTMFVLLATSAARPRIIESLVYFCVLVVMRSMGRKGGLWISICIVWVMSMYFIQQFFFIGMPSGTEWGPFYEDRSRIGSTWLDYWEYFGAFPSRWDLFASFLCSAFIMLHFRYNKRYEPVNENYDIYECDTLTEFLSQEVEVGVTRRNKLISLRQQPDFTMEKLEELLPAPRGHNFVVKPKDVPSRLHAYWIKYLPYLCLTLVFIDATAAEFITVIRMGKLALAMYLFRVWEVMEWRGNALWKSINDYFLFALVVHLIWNIPYLADRWEHSDVVKKLYSFVGIMECHNNDYGSSKECVGDLIQVNAFEILIMSLLYLQRLNYDNFAHVWVIHQSHRNDLKALDIKQLIDVRLRERKEAGLLKTRELVEERHRILERTKQELHGRRGAGRRNNQMFPPPRIIDDPKLKPRERKSRQRLREAALEGFMAGRKGEFPDSLIKDDDDNETARNLRRTFELGQGANVDVPEEYLQYAEHFVKGLLEGPNGIDEIEPKTPEEAAFLAGKNTAALFMPQETITAAVVGLAAIMAAAAAEEKKKTTAFMHVVLYFQRKTLLGQKDLTTKEIERKPWVYLFDGLLLYLKESSDLVCYIIFAVNFSISVSLLDMFPTASVFLYSLLIVPRPPAVYWEIMLMFMQCLLALKCVVQALEVTFDDQMPEGFATFYGSLGKSSFFMNVLGDFCAILAIIARQGVLRSWGIYRETKVVPRVQSPLRRRLSVSSIKSSSSTMNRLVAAKESALRRDDGPPVELKEPDGVFDKIKHFFLRVKAVYLKALDPLEKAGTDKDYYIKSFIVDLVSIVLFIAIYQQLGSENEFNLGDAISQNLLPGALVLGTIVLVLTMVADRVIYLLADLRAKFVMQVVMTLTYMIGFFVWFQDYNTSSESGHVAAAFFFLVRAVWLYLSAKQIERGYPVVRRHDCFTDTSDFKVFLAYQICRAIPFLWEMRVLLDWCCSKTTLKLSYWLKLEDVRNEMLVRKMDIEDSKTTNPKPGTSFPTLKKITSGWLLIAVMLVLIFFPLLYYSTFSPALQMNSVQQLSIGLAFDGAPPFYQNDVLIQGEASKDDELAKALSRTRGSVRSQSVTSSTKNLQLLEFSAFSTQRWLITDPAAAALAGKFRNASVNPEAVPNLVTSLEVTRTAGAQSDLDMKTYLRYKMDTTNQTQMEAIVDLLLWDGVGEEPPSVYLPALTTPFLLNKPSSLGFLSSTSDCFLTVLRTTGTNPDGATKYYEIRCRGLFSCGDLPGAAEQDCVDGTGKCPNYDHDPIPPCPTGDGLVPLSYVAISDMAQNDDSPLAGIFNIGIIALYVTFVLAVGRVIRSIISGSAAAVVIQDMEDPTFISRMADHVHLARGDGNLKLEEELYYHLINLLRSPEKVLSITGLRTPPSA